MRQTSSASASFAFVDSHAHVYVSMSQFGRALIYKRSFRQGTTDGVLILSPLFHMVGHAPSLGVWVQWVLPSPVLWLQCCASCVLRDRFKNLSIERCWKRVIICRILRVCYHTTPMPLRSFSRRQTEFRMLVFKPNAPRRFRTISNIHGCINP